MVRTIVVAANGSGKKCITWKTANAEALLESKGKGTICIMQGPSNSQCVCTSHRSRGGKRCTCFALIFSPFFRVFIETFWELFSTFCPASPYSSVSAGGLERGGMRRSCKCSSCELQSTPRSKLPVGSRPPPKHHSYTRAQNIMFSG